MAGFFGLEWTKNATIEVIIEQDGFNNSLAGYDNCANSNNHRNAGGNTATVQWVATYLQNATARFQSQLHGINWTIADTYAAQTMCPYETVSPAPSSPPARLTRAGRLRLLLLLQPLHLRRVGQLRIRPRP